jgi:hypothetical protein
MKDAIVRDRLTKGEQQSDYADAETTHYHDRHDDDDSEF